MHLHEKRCIKRAGVAGIALRAEGAMNVKEKIKGKYKVQVTIL